MSRYVLSPSKCEGQFMLLPTEGISDQIKTIELPEGVFPKFEYNNLLVKLSKANVRRNKDGLIVIENKPVNINYDDFVNDCFNNNFKTKYELIFCNLRQNGVTF